MCVAQNIRIVARTGSLNETRTVSASSRIVEVYDSETVDIPPTFPGGNSALVRYINSSRQYPAEAYSKGIHGRVLCSFVVQPDGSISHINVIKSVEPTLDREAVRIIDEMPPWEAGSIDGIPVPVYYMLPIAFRL